MENFSWKTLEYQIRKKTGDWYWAVGIISAALVVTAIIFGNVLFGIVLAIGAFTLTMFASRRPDVITVNVNEKGINVNDTLYPYPTLDSFSIDENHYQGPRLILKSKKVVLPLIAVPLVLDNPDELRTFLASHLKEETFEPGIMQTIFDRLGF